VRPRAGLWALALAALLAGGCSRIGLGWRLAPTWLKHEASSWMGISGDEKAALDADVDAYLRRLALQVAPQAGAWSRHLAKLVAQKQDKAAVDSLFDDGLALWKSIKAPGVDPAAAWLVRRPLDRARALQKEFKREADREAGVAGGLKQAAERSKHLKEWLADWLGDLDAPQEARVDAFVAQARYPVEGVNADRRRREQALLAALQAQAPQEELAGQLRRWWLAPESDRARDTERAIQDYRNGLRAMLKGLLGTLSDEQRDRLVRRLDALAEDLDGIYRKAVTQGP
jgi:hypothetical protein